MTDLDQGERTEYVECWGEVTHDELGRRWCPDCKPSTQDRYVAGAYERFDSAVREARARLRMDLDHLTQGASDV